MSEELCMRAVEGLRRRGFDAVFANPQFSPFRTEARGAQRGAAEPREGRKGAGERRQSRPHTQHRRWYCVASWESR